jgi:hypothetical protein
MPSAVKHLAELATNAPPAVQRQAVNDIITLGRKVPKLELSRTLFGAGAITINLMSFTDSDYGKKVASGEITTEVIAAAPRIPEAEVIDVDVDADAVESESESVDVRIQDFGD